MKSRVLAVAACLALSAVGCIRAPTQLPVVDNGRAAPTYAHGLDPTLGEGLDGTRRGEASGVSLVNNPTAPSPAAIDEEASNSNPAGATAIESEQASPVAAVLLPFQKMSFGSLPLGAKVAARRYGNLSPVACGKELRAWQGTFKRAGAQKGVATPTRVIGVVEGVRFRVPGEKSKFGVLDCRLALTLVEFARFLSERGVAEVVVDNFYRVNARLPSARSKRSQHAYGLAIDLRSFRLADGRVWDVEKDWGASTDTEACGPEATLASATEHTEGLRTLVCELFAAQIFSHHLTPSHDAAHRNHLHLDIKRGAKTAVIR